jgi:hypothetical protein
MKQFVILFRQGPHLFTEAGRARRQAAIIAWAREQNARGHRLEPRTLAPSFTRPGIEVTEDDHGKWPVSALLFLEAHDLTEASAIAATHPAKDYNVSMEVRPWTPAGTPALAKAS